MATHVRVGDWLFQNGHVNRLQLETALAVQRSRGGLLGEILVDMGCVSEAVVLAVVSHHFAVPYVELDGAQVPHAIVRVLPEKLIRRLRVFPLAIEAQQGRTTLVVATSHPQDLAALDDVAFACGYAVKPVLATRRAIELAIEHHFGAPGAARGEVAIMPPPRTAPIRTRADGTPVRALPGVAVEQRASAA